MCPIAVVKSASGNQQHPACQLHASHTLDAPLFSSWNERQMNPIPRREVVSAIPALTREPRRLAARLEPFDSYWQAPKDVEKGYKSFEAYYRANYLPHLPQDRNASILVV